MKIYVIERKFNCTHQYGATLTKERALEEIKELEKICEEKKLRISDYTGAYGFYIKEYEISTQYFTLFD